MNNTKFINYTITGKTHPSTVSIKILREYKIRFRNIGRKLEKALKKMNITDTDELEKIGNIPKSLLAGTLGLLT